VLADIPANAVGFWPTVWIVTSLGFLAAISAGLWIPVWAGLKWLGWLAVGKLSGRTWREAREDSQEWLARPRRSWMLYLFQFGVLMGATAWLAEAAPEVYSGHAIYGVVAAYAATLAVLKLASLRRPRRQKFARLPLRSENLGGH
jgi:hypothetical protein